MCYISLAKTIFHPLRSRFPNGKSVHFFVVWSFLLFGLFGCHFFLLFARGRVLFFAVWAGAQAPPKQKNKNTPPPEQKKKNAPAPSERVVFFAVWAGGCVYLFAVWAEVAFFFFCLGGVRVLFLLFGRGVCSVFCCLGRGRAFFLLFGRGTGVHSLTGLPGSSLSDPTTKKTKQPKKTRVPFPNPKSLNPKPPNRKPETSKP